MSNDEQLTLCAIYFVVQLLIGGSLGAIVGGRRHARKAGMILGMLFGPLGIIVAFALDGRPRCPKCKARVEPGAAICAGCHTSLSPADPEPEYDDEEPETVDFACRHCQNVMTRPIDDVGKNVICDCGELIKVKGKRPTLRDCPDCRREISRRAASCPHCGCPTA